MSEPVPVLREQLASALSCVETGGDPMYRVDALKYADAILPLILSAVEDARTVQQETAWDEGRAEGERWALIPPGVGQTISGPENPYRAVRLSGGTT